jgi:UDP-3-O-[3-hydroxymyristoyl] glucosamine N-acyltransferase
MTATYDAAAAARTVGAACELLGDSARTFSRATTLEQAAPDAIVWVASRNAAKSRIVAETTASVVVCDAAAVGEAPDLRNKTLLVVGDPRLAFLRIVAQFFQRRPTPAIHPTACVHPHAQLGADVFIGPFTYVGRAKIGAQSVIYGHVHIYDDVSIGERVTIHAGTVIGSDGYGYQRNEAGVLEKFPHIGGVVIEDDVEIGANTTIDRGSLGNTVIRERARVDNLVHVAHNVEIGADAAVIANTMIGGSTQIGAKAWIAPSVTLRDGIKVGAGATIGLAALVVKSVPDNELWAGSPAKKWD